MLSRDSASGTLLSTSNAIEPNSRLKMESTQQPGATLLQRYIQSASGYKGFDNNESGIISGQPILKKDRTDRILVYNGCFNPPHHGHLAHLTHALQHCGADLGVIGAVVLVANDTYLLFKFGRRPGITRLSEAQRILLWRSELDSVSGGASAGCEYAGGRDVSSRYALRFVTSLRGERVDRVLTRSLPAPAPASQVATRLWQSYRAWR
ncbi:hypothetical protein GGR54DRAFT_246208 [Hypoxylon sp. NC1633]|nr:hypothetical protein GGR54DRAFT_246208 [Hypoxylon sp. NC1633]